MSLSVTGSDVTIKQISKDLSRDRIIIQGRRIEGSEAGIKGVLAMAVSSAETVIKEGGGTIIETSLNEYQQHQQRSGGFIFTSEIIEEFCLTSLGQLGRTESAYASLFAVTTVVDQAAQPDIILVPESILAHPLLMRFRLTNKTNTTSTTPSNTNAHTHTNNNNNNTTNNRTYGAGVRPSPLLSGSSPSKTSSSTSSSSISSRVNTNHQSPLTQPVQKRGSPLLANPQNQPRGSTLTHTNTNTNNNSHSTNHNMTNNNNNNNNSAISTSKTLNNSITSDNHPGIICDMQATTVYRFAHAETMQTVLQIKVTFCQSIKLLSESQLHLPIQSPPNNNTEEDAEALSRAKELRRKQIQRLFILSKSFVIIDRDTRTSNRDWR